MKTLYKIVILAFLLNGCAGKSPTDDMVDTANQTIDTMYNAIPKECRNDTITNLRDTSKKQIQSINDACSLQKDLLNEKIRERNIIIISLCLLILLGVGAKLFLRPRQ